MLMAADLPEDIDTLRAFALEQSRLLAEERAAVAKIAIAKGEADAQNERLQAIIDAFMRHRFGARSEQLDPHQLQLGLEDSETALAETKAAEEAKANSRVPTARARPTVVRCPRISSGSNNSSMLKTMLAHQIGEDVSERLDVVPTTFRVLITRRPRYGCRSCESAVVQAPAPARIVEGGLPTEALIAQVLVAKYADHLPLYRQAQIYARQASSLIARRWRTGSAGRHGAFAPCETISWNSCDDPSDCLPTRPRHRCSIQGAGEPRPASYGPMPAMTGHGAAWIRRWSPMSMRPTARVNGPRRISAILPGYCRSMAMAVTPRSPNAGSR